MSNNNPLQNAAYSDQYIEECKKYEPLFRDENKRDTKNVSLPHGYTITKTHYEGKIESCYLKGQICVLGSYDEPLIHSWKNYNNNCDFEKIIFHRNSNLYLIYKQELYGYTVFDLTARKEFQYYPQGVLDGREYFIWTDVYYNPANNLLAVPGCIWACPWSILLVDFSDPMTTPESQIDVIDCLAGDYDVYDDAEFVRWDGRDIIVNGYNMLTKSRENISVTSDIIFEKRNL